VEQGSVTEVLKEPSVVIEMIKMIGYVLGAGLPAYFGYRIVKSRMGGKQNGVDK
jgi:hypothetical protein